MPDVRADYEHMTQVANMLNQYHGDITEKLTQLKSAVDNLVSEGYVTDVSSKKFEEGYNEFNSGVTQTLEGMNELSRFLTTKIHQLQEADAG